MRIEQNVSYFYIAFFYTAYFWGTRLICNRLLFWFVGLMGIFAVAGCTTGKNANDASLRLINASRAYSSLDLYAGSTKEISAIASEAVSDYVGLSAGTYTTVLTGAGSTTAQVSLSTTLASANSYTLLAYGESGSLHSVLLSDEETTPDSGYSKLRLFNTATNAGTLDVYLTAAGSTSIADSATLASGMGVGSQSGYVQEGKGSFDIWVTGYADKTDVRLHIKSVALADGQVASLILTSSSGGVLVNGLWLVQKGSLTTYPNTDARVRLVAGVTDNKSVAASIGSTVLSSGVVSPAVGAYALVSAETYTPSISVDGNAVNTSLTLSAGADYSLLVYGKSAAAQVQLLTDDNNFPVDTTKAKFRLVHGDYDQSGSQLSMSADFSYLVTNVTYGSASSFANLTAGTVGDLSVVSTNGTTVFEKNPTAGISVAARSIYTVWMLGNGTGVLLKDR